MSQSIHSTVFVAEGAHLIGDVSIGPESGIWYNAVLRGDNAPIIVGTQTNIQEGCVLHGEVGVATIVGDRVTVGHGAIVHGCTIGDDSLVGMGAIVLTGARVGKGVLIAAGALVPQNMEIPDGVLVIGSPAKIRRPLTPEEQASNRKASDDYVCLARDARLAQEG